MYSPYSNYKHVRIYGLLSYLYSQAQLRPSLGSCDVKFSQSDSNLSDFEVISVSEVGGSRNRVSTGTEELLKKYRPLGKNCLREGKCFIFLPETMTKCERVCVFFLPKSMTKCERVCVFFLPESMTKCERICVYFLPENMTKCERVCVFFLPESMAKCERAGVFFLPESMAKCERVCVFVLPETESMGKCERVCVVFFTW